MCKPTKERYLSFTSLNLEEIVEGTYVHTLWEWGRMEPYHMQKNEYICGALDINITHKIYVIICGREKRVHFIDREMNITIPFFLKEIAKF